MRVKHLIEKVMNSIFFICGMVAIACVVLITIYMLVSGLPAIFEIGPCLLYTSFALMERSCSTCFVKAR